MYPVPIGSGLGEIRGPIFFDPWFHGARLRDTSHGTMGRIERSQHSEGSRWRRSCHSKNRDHAGWCWASAPTGFVSVRLIIFSDARRATAGSMRGITYGLRTTKAPCRTRCKIKRNSATDHQPAPVAYPKSAKIETEATNKWHRSDHSTAMARIVNHEAEVSRRYSIATARRLISLATSLRALVSLCSRRAASL